MSQKRVSKYLYHKNRILKCIKDVIPSTSKTCIWLIKLTVGVSFAMVFLEYFNILPWFSELISPLFAYLGLPGEAALPFVTGYFVNVYAAVSLAMVLEFDVRVMTILSVMILCAHNMITETLVQKKTGSSATRIVITRTLSAFILAYLLNILLPGEVVIKSSRVVADNLILNEMLVDWLKSTINIVITMCSLIFLLTIFQKLLAEYGAIRWISRFLKPVMVFFGLPPRASFLWIIANTLGLAYGAATMIEEYRDKKIDSKDMKLLNTHISISHSNLEDVLLVAAIGGTWYILLLSRWIASLFLVWEQKLEYYLKENMNFKFNYYTKKH